MEASFFVGFCIIIKGMKHYFWVLFCYVFRLLSLFYAFSGAAAIGNAENCVLLFTPFTITFANPFKIRFANGSCSHLYENEKKVDRILREGL